MKTSRLNLNIEKRTVGLATDFEGQMIYAGNDLNGLVSEVLQQHNAKRPLLVYDASFGQSDIYESIGKLPFDFIDANLDVDAVNYQAVDAALKLFRQHECDFVISIGSAAIIDGAKCIKAFSALEHGKNYLSQKLRFSPVKHLAIPTTACTGNESKNHCTILSDDGAQKLSHECMLPEYVVLDAKLLLYESDYQKKSALMDALCQAIDSFWSIKSTDASMKHAEQAIDMILNSYKKYLSGDLAAASAIQLAANYGGRAANISGTSGAHAMSERLASLHEIAHGHAVGLCLPAVWRFLVDRPERCVDPRGISHLRKALERLNALFGVSSSDEAISKFSSILMGLGLESFTDEYGALKNAIDGERLNNSPIDLGHFGIAKIVKNALATRDSNIANASLDEHKRRTLEAYDWFEKICAENDLSFVVLGGSLVGALRHDGFVPWDDDIDIGIRLPDLEKFRKLSKSSLPPGFAWSHPDTNRRHPRLFGKIVYNGRCCIDVFPIVKTSGDDLFSKVHHKAIRYLYQVYLRKLRWGKCPRNGLKKRIFWYMTKFSSLFISRNRILKLSCKVMDWYEDKEAKRYISICGRYPHKKELIEKDWIEKGPEYVFFEGRRMPVFHDYQDYLTRLYGNYMIMPPVDKRVSDHVLRIPMYNINGVIPSYMPRLQKMECEMLKEFIAICKQYNLKYYAISGTTLGAVRHKGFIPWDDDVDIGMPREDYDTFLQVAQKHLSDHLFLQTYETEPGCPRYFAKIRNSNTTFIEVSAKPDNRNRGIYIDIFPLDGFPSKKIKQLQCRVNKAVFDVCINYLYNNFSIKRSLTRPDFLKRAATRFLGFVATKTKYRGYDIQKINRAKEKYFTQFSYSECEYVFSYGGVYGMKEKIPKSYLGEGIEVEFEDLRLVIPEKFHEYLTHFYGDYMRFPAEHKRSVGHPRKIVDLDRSYRFYQKY